MIARYSWWLRDANAIATYGQAQSTIHCLLCIYDKIKKVFAANGHQLCVHKGDRCRCRPRRDRMQGTRGTSRDGPGSIDASSADLARSRSRELARGRAGRGSAGAVGLRPGAGGAVGVRRDAVSLGGQPARERGCRPKADVDVGFSDLLQDLNGAVMLDLELRKGRFGLISDTVYANLKDDG